MRGWLSCLVGPADLSRAQQARLVATLFEQWRALLIGKLAMAAIAALAWYRSGSALYLLWGSVAVLVFLARHMVNRAYARDRARPEVRREPRFWARLFTVGAIASGLVWGLAVACMVPLAHDPLIRLILIAGQAGYITAAAVRNCASPAASIGQTVLVLSLTPIGLWLSGDLYLRLFMFFPLVQMLANVEITRYLGQQTLSLLLAEQKLTDANFRLSATCTDLTSANVQLARLSDTDGLTGIANRRCFDAALAAEWARAMRESTPVALLLIDVDFFKAFNDETGHLAGDECLCRIAAALAASVSRPADLVARFGGEEFVVLLPGTGIEGACDVAVRMRAALGGLGIAHPGSPLRRVSASFGAAAMVPWDAATVEALIDAADRALYRAKQSGRDRVCLATEATVARGIA